MLSGAKHNLFVCLALQVVYAAFGGGPRRYRGGDNRGRRDEGPSVPINEMIRAPEVRVVTALKEPLGVMPTLEALDLARREGVDLILVVADASPPVCRLMPLSKYNYELTKAAKDAKKRQREMQIETKELKLRPATDVHDYQVKVRAAQKFLSKGARVKLTVQFKGREMEFKGIGRELFDRFLEDLGGEEAISIESPAQMQGRQMNMVLSSKKIEPQQDEGEGAT
jgi:translation initiation factor IF-3